MARSKGSTAFPFALHATTKKAETINEARTTDVDIGKPPNREGMPSKNKRGDSFSGVDEGMRGRCKFMRVLGAYNLPCDVWPTVRNV